MDETKTNPDTPEKHDIEVNSNVLKKDLHVKQENDEDNDSDKEEVKISGCRRRIMNRPNKRNSKSKSFCEQRKFRSHSPMPERKQHLNEQSVKTKVLYSL